MKIIWIYRSSILCRVYTMQANFNSTNLFHFIDWHLQHLTSSPILSVFYLQSLNPHTSHFSLQNCRKKPKKNLQTHNFQQNMYWIAEQTCVLAIGMRCNLYIYAERKFPGISWGALKVNIQQQENNKMRRKKKQYAIKSNRTKLNCSECTSKRNSLNLKANYELQPWEESEIDEAISKWQQHWLL